MTPEQRERVKSLFSHAADLPREQRESYIKKTALDDADVAAEALALLARLDDADFMIAPTVTCVHDAPTEPVSNQPDTHVGRYKLLERIGEGGFGTVWMAEQREPVVRKVALKIIKLGMDTRQVIARFEAERQALALMDHPNIAKVLDAGATETGRPYFVMELCTGDSITGYCDKNNLSIPDRLELFAQVCMAVQHAHQKGLIHRDIKPSNILVTTQDGRPHAKVIDFGIAKATANRLTEKTLFTQHKQLIGTPQYMSPEQAVGSLDIDTRTDVYSLGVLLYELLTGATPFDPNSLRSAAYAEIQRIIREVEPPKPSTRISQNTDTLASVAAQRNVEPKKFGTIIRGELDWIVMKCLEKDRQRRYETANGLATDVRRYLAGEAVIAAPPSTAYRFRKFVRRNKATVTAATVVAAALVLGMIGTGLSLRRALRAESGLRDQLAETRKAQQAEAARADELKQVSDFQEKMLAQVDPTTAGVKLTQDFNRRFVAALKKAKIPKAERRTQVDAFRAQWARVNVTDAAMALIDETILTPAVKAVDKQFNNQPLVDAQLRQVLALRYRDLGLLEKAVPLVKQALETRRRMLGDEHPDTLMSILSMGLLHHDQGEFVEAEQYDREGLEKSRRVLGEEHPHTLIFMNNMGSLLQAQGKLSEAEPYYREGLEKSRRVFGESHPDTVRAINNMGFLLKAQGKLVEAEPYYREALDMCRRVLGEEHEHTLTCMINLGSLLKARGNLAEAEPLYREALEKARRVLGEEHPRTLLFMHNMGALLHQQGKLAEAESYYREALEKRRSVLGDEHPDTFQSMNNLGSLLQSRGKLVEAEPYIRDALEKRRRVLGEEHPDTLMSMNSLGGLLLAQGKFNEAEPYYREALEKCRRVLGEEHPDTLTSIGNMGSLLIDQGKLDEAQSYLRDALESRRRILGEEHPDTLVSINMMGGLLMSQRKFAEAEPFVREALEKRRRVFGDEHPDTLRSVNNLGSLLERRGNLAEAERYLREGLEKSRHVLGEEHRSTIACINNMGALLEQQGKLAEAESYYHEALEKFRRALGEEHPDTLASISNLGALLAAHGKLAEAEGVYAEGVRASARAFKSPHPQTAWLLHHHADTLQALGRLDEALADAQRAAEMYRAHPKWSPTEAAHALSILSAIFAAQGKLDETLSVQREFVALQRATLAPGSEALGNILAGCSRDLLQRRTIETAREAEPLLRECLKIREATTPDDWRVANTRSMLGEAVLLIAELDSELTPAARSDRLREAEPLLLDGYAGLNNNPAVPAPAQVGSDHRREALARILHLYELWDRAEPSRGYDAKVADWNTKLDARNAPKSSQPANK